MINSTSQFFAILTNVGVAKQANADALGVPWKIAQMGIGDANGTDPLPSAAQTKLINEWRRAPLNQLKVDPANSAIIIAEQVIPAEVGGFWIREIALYDTDGDMVAVANCAPSFKPLLTQGSGRTQVVRVNLLVSNSSNVELKIDPSVVLATRDYVDTRILEELNKQDFKFSVLVASTAAIQLNGVQTVDDVVPPVGTRVLAKNQPLPKDNGIYVVANAAWLRAPDADTSIEVTPGLFVHVEKGTTNGDSVWQLETDGPIILGTTDLLFGMAMGRTGVAAGTYRSVTVDKNGRVVAGTNPTTIAGYGITDAYTKVQVDLLAALTAQATETNQGTGKIATQTQTDAGLDDSTIVTPKKLRWGVSISLGQNSYVVFPSWLGGWIFQWGTVTDGWAEATAWPLPMAFPTAIYKVIATMRGSVDSSTSMSCYWDKTASSLTSIRVGRRYANNGGSVALAVQGCDYIAIGK